MLPAIAAFAQETPPPDPPSAADAPAEEGKAGEDAAPAEGDDAPEEPEREEKTLVITATRVPQPKETVSTPVQTIPKAEIERSGARHLGELLSGRSLVDIRTYGGLGGLQLPTLRGLSAEQTLVIVDGRRINPPNGGGPDLSDLDLLGVRRVEVLRGPASALYGSDAMGGVIQIVTDVPDGPARTGLQQEIGSMGYRSLRFSRTEKTGKLGYLVTARRVTSTGDFAYYHPVRRQNLHRLNSDFDHNTFRVTLLPEFGGPGRLRILFDGSDAERGAPGPLESPSTARQEDRQTALEANYRIQRDAASLSYMEVRAYTQQFRRLYDASRDRPLAIRTLQKTRTHGMEAITRAEWGGFLLTGGAEYRRETLNSNRLSPKDRDVTALYALGRMSRGRWTVSPSLRWDSISVVGSQVSPQTGLLGRLSDNWSVKANLGRAFRAPSFNDLYWPEDAFSLGNDALRPERAVTADLGATFTRGPWNADLTLFSTRVRDLILWTPGAVKPGKWSPVNVGRARVQGVELSARWRGGLWEARAGGSLLDAEDRTSGSPTQGKQLTYRPSALAFLNLDWGSGGWGVGADLAYSGRRFISADNSSRLGGYTFLNLRVRRAFGRWEAALIADNLFDKRYQIMAGYPLPGRELRLSLQQRL